MGTPRRAIRILLAVVLLPGCGAEALAAGGDAASRRTLVRWSFGGEHGWSGWTPSPRIEKVRLDGPGVEFQTRGADPQVLGPRFELAPATGDQWVEIDLETDGPGEGELFYTSKTTGRYGGLEPAWMCRVIVPSAGRQTIRVWPFWGGLARIVRLRFDPPAGCRCRLNSLAVVELARRPAAPAWSFAGAGATSWSSLHAARPELTGRSLRVTASGSQAMVVSPVTPFDARERALLRVDGECPGEPVLGVYWVTREANGLHGEPVELLDPGGGVPPEIDLRRFATWKGTVTHVALGFGTRGGEVLTLRSLRIDPVDPDRPFLRLRRLAFRDPVRRAGASTSLCVELENAGGATLEASLVRVASDGRLAMDAEEPRIGPLEPGGVARLDIGARCIAPGWARVRLGVGRQIFERRLRVDPPLPAARPGEYAVPPPRPVPTRYRIGAYYFPGWSADQLDRWRKQAGFPEREPVLGWYAEGLPEVADWHIKWAVENGISFFVYDWYWRSGREELGAALSKGFLRARYRDRLEFALMWANHPPFSAHTPAQLVAVTDYWIERYLRRPNYLRVRGVPYVSFFSPGELLAGLGSEEAVAAALESMRERARAAGLPGLHIAACSGPGRPSIDSLGRSGFDSITAYNYLRTGALAAHSSYRAFVLGHEPIWDASAGREALPYTPVLTVGWDSRPWHGPRAERKFARRTVHLREALARLRAWLDDRGQTMAILEAWNEWGEGSYIEPGSAFGFEDLEAVRDVFCEPGARPPNVAPQDLGLGARYDLRGR